jgi:hypothetical protein
VLLLSAGAELLLISGELTLYVPEFLLLLVQMGPLLGLANLCSPCPAV